MYDPVISKLKMEGGMATLRNLFYII